MAKRLISPRDVIPTCCGGNIVKNDVIYGNGNSICQDIDVNILSDSDLSVPLTPLEVYNTWYLSVQNLGGSQTVNWNPSGYIEYRRTSGNGDYYVGFYGDDGMGGFINIDTTVQQTLSFDFDLITPGSGKHIIVTLISIGDNKYYQKDVSGNPNGTNVVIIDPVDWAAMPMADPTPVLDFSTIVSFWSSIGNNIDGTTMDEFNLDNITLTHIECQ